MYCNESGALPTIRVLLQRVGDQAAVIRTGWQKVWDAVVVIIFITLVSLAVLVGVQLGAVDDGWTVVPRVLVTVTVTGRETLLLARADFGLGFVYYTDH